MHHTCVCVCVSVEFTVMVHSFARPWRHRSTSPTSGASQSWIGQRSGPGQDLHSGSGPMEETLRCWGQDQGFDHSPHQSSDQQWPEPPPRLLPTTDAEKTERKDVAVAMVTVQPNVTSRSVFISAGHSSLVSAPDRRVQDGGQTSEFIHTWTTTDNDRQRQTDTESWSLASPRENKDKNNTTILSSTLRGVNAGVNWVKMTQSWESGLNNSDLITWRHVMVVTGEPQSRHVSD